MSFGVFDHSAASMLEAVIQHQKQGEPFGVYAACTANAYAIRAVLQQAFRDGTGALIESTASQVNLSGGYTGLTPHLFRRQVLQMAMQIGLPLDRIIIGGDHIGPHPWRHASADHALQQASALASACVLAGYRKMHLDTTTPCGNEARQSDGSLPLELISRRAADLCRVAERTARQAGLSPPYYVIGSDVPPPGGGDMAEKTVPVTDVEQIEETVSACRRAFEDRGLSNAWQRVVALVVQTGVEFTPRMVHPYASDRMQPLVAYIRQTDHLVFEAHSTDFQTPAALARMVADHFGILKVGPALTYAMREAFFALAEIEKDAFEGRKSVAGAYLPAIMEDVMVSDPGSWQHYYRGSEEELAYLRRHAYSDRIRYYWSRPEAQAALKHLFATLRQTPPPLSLVLQHLPEAGQKIRDGRLANDPEQIVLDRIGAVANRYARACNPVLA
ncbi:MAG: class II D-tagatose-bisphosphate aldolase, non-catalytic subunit [Deltaproteobacteria bacterium]|nr:class II D-tagatose-bisphosphate aldolase, non-catalytic subunit [Deltaproteobacteria bacterium]